MVEWSGVEWSKRGGQCELKSVDLPFHGLIEEPEELSKGRLVHAVDHGHLHDEEVEDGATGRYGTILFPGGVDLDLRVGGHLKLVVDLDGRVFGGVEDSDERFVVHQ